MRTLLSSILLSVFLGLVGCGGSSSSSDPGNTGAGSAPSLIGDYHAVQFMDDEVNSGGYIIASTMTTNFSGAGSASFQLISNSLNQGGAGSFTYTIQSDGQWATSDNQSGMVSSDGSIFLLTDTDVMDDAVHIMIGLKAAVGMATSDLSGEFICVMMADDEVNSGGNVRSVVGQATFDGNGNFVLETLSSSDGYINSIQVGTYSVQNDGRVFFAGSDLTGFVSADGNTVLLADTAVSDDDIGVGIGLKKSSGMSIVDAMGDFVGANAIDRTLLGDTTKTALIAYTCEGSDQISYQERSASDGNPGTGTHPMAISADGCIVGLAGTTGILSSDGEIFIHGSAHQSQDVNGIEIGIRKNG